MSLAAGTRLGRYEIVESLGADADALERFTREARALAALNHPHIVTIYSTEEADGVRFLTMELIEGRTLDQVIPERGVSLPQFFDVAIALADALAAAHDKHITHRDLKPGNVMVTGAGRVKVLDFGLARANAGAAAGGIDEEATRLALTQAGAILGTSAYMSPEQIEGKPLDGRSDLEPSTVWKQIGLPMAYHALGRKAESEAALAKLIAEQEAHSAFNIASVLAFRGEPDRAFEWLDKAVTYHDSGISTASFDHLLDGLHADPRWLPFLRRIGKAPEQLAAIKFEVTPPKEGS